MSNTDKCGWKDCKKSGDKVKSDGFCQPHSIAIRVQGKPCEIQGCSNIPAWVLEPVMCHDHHARRRAGLPMDEPYDWRGNSRSEVVGDSTYSSAERAAAKNLLVEVVQKDVIYRRDDGICHLCGNATEGEWEMDHVIPLAAGGPHCERNLAVSHADCNRAKSNTEDLSKMTSFGDRFIEAMFAFKEYHAISVVNYLRLNAQQRSGVNVRSAFARGSDKNEAYIWETYDHTTDPVFLSGGDYDERFENYDHKYPDFVATHGSYQKWADAQTMEWLMAGDDGTYGVEELSTDYKFAEMMSGLEIVQSYAIGEDGRPVYGVRIQDAEQGDP